MQPAQCCKFTLFLTTCGRYRPPDSAWLALPTALRYGNMMWHDGVCSSCWIETGAAYAPGKEWNKRILKENNSVLTLPSFSLSSLASPYETICHMLPSSQCCQGRAVVMQQRLHKERYFLLTQSFDLETMPILIIVLQLRSQMLSFFTVKHTLFAVYCTTHFHLPSTLGTCNTLEDIFLLGCHLKYVRFLALKAKCL